MDEELIIEQMPEVSHPVVILGFEGWANGGNVAIGMIDYLIKKFGAIRFARIDPNIYYRFDDARPVVKVEGGRLKEVLPPEAAFYSAKDEESGVDMGQVLGRVSENPRPSWQSGPLPTADSERSQTIQLAGRLRPGSMLPQV